MTRRKSNTTKQIIALLLATGWSLLSNVGNIDYLEWLFRCFVCKHSCVKKTAMLMHINDDMHIIIPRHASDNSIHPSCTELPHNGVII